MSGNQTPAPPVRERSERAGNLVTDLLNAGYVQATQQVTTAILRNSTDGVMGTRLAEFEAEAKRLAEEGQPMQADNPYFRALLSDFQATLNRQAGMADGAAGDVQGSGAGIGQTMARQLSLPGFDDAQLASVGIQWNVPDPEAVAQLVQYVNSDAWANEMNTFGDDILNVVNNAAIRGVAEGKNPLSIAREVREFVETLPLYKASNLLRTLQLTSYRDSTSAAYVANADILEYQVRIATLDSRTCMACVSLHGTRLEIGERVDDHHAGRCLVPGQLVTTARGDIPIEQVRKGDFVLTHRGRYRRVMNIFSRSYNDEVIEIGNGSRRVVLTPEHPILTQRGWVEARRLSASDTLLTLNSVDVRVSRRKISQPIATNWASRRASRSSRDFVVCQRGSHSTPSSNSGNAKSMLYEPTANCGIGSSPCSRNASRKWCSCGVQNVCQLTCRCSARLCLDSGVCDATIMFARKSGLRSIWRATASERDIGSIPARRISFINGRVLMPNSAVISRYEARCSMYRRHSQDSIGSPMRASSALSQDSERREPNALLANPDSPNVLRRLSIASFVRPKALAISADVSLSIDARMNSSSSADQTLPPIKFPPKSITTIVHHPMYSGNVYDLEVEEDHSFFAEGIVVHNCTSVGILKGRPVNVQTGADWFGSLSEAQQREQMGPGAYAAWQAGAIRLEDFPHRYDDPVFGQMIRENSLKGLLGDAARNYYQN